MTRAIRLALASAVLALEGPARAHHGVAGISPADKTCRATFTVSYSTRL